MTDEIPSNENLRWIPRKQIELATMEREGKDIGDSHCHLNPCPTWIPKTEKAGVE